MAKRKLTPAPSDVITDELAEPGSQAEQQPATELRRQRSLATMQRDSTNWTTSAGPKDAMGQAARKWQLRRCINRWSASYAQPNDLSRSLVALNQNSTIIAAIEMSQSSWLVAGMLPVRRP